MLQLPDGCKVYDGTDCNKRYAELNAVAAKNLTSRAQQVQQLHVQPVTTVTRLSRSDISLDVSWTLPRCRTHSDTAVRGVKVTVTALDDVSHYAVCHLLDFTAVSWPALNTSLQPNTTVKFEALVPGSYNLWIQRAGSVGDVCARIGVLRFASRGISSTSLPPTTSAIIINSTTAKDDSRHHHTEGNTGPSTVDQSDFNNSHSDNNNNNNNTMVTAAIAACVSFVVVTLLLLVTALCWRRHRGQTHRCAKIDLPCMEKLTAQVPCQSTTDSHSDAPQTGPPDTTLSSPSSPPLTVFLLSHSALPPHTHVTDCFALYLQASCACDVTYARWQKDELLQSAGGPEEWTVKQLVRSDRVIFVHSPDTRDCYEAWRLGLLKGKQNDVEVRILATVFQHVSKAERSSSSSAWFDITFCADFSGASGGDFSLVSPGEKWPACGRGWVKQGQNTADAETEKATARWSLAKGVNVTSSNPRSFYYLLMNDFSRLLADLHNLPNSPRVFKDRDLPVDSQHLDTQKGRALYKAVAAFNSGPKGCSGEGPTGDHYPAKAGTQKIDSGFQDMDHLSFFAPEDLSIVDSESVSLAERFHAVNARYELAMVAEREMFHPECYSLGGRFV
ncbi:hypothetical protein ACOMHN_022283 [Nucella lapillus]